MYFLHTTVSWKLVSQAEITKRTSRSGRARKALKSVMVLPEPGGPHRTIGLCSNSHVDRSASCRTVSMVGITTSGAPTLWVSTSTCGTFADHATHSPVIDTCRQQPPYGYRACNRLLLVPSLCNNCLLVFSFNSLFFWWCVVDYAGFCQLLSAH